MSLKKSRKRIIGYRLKTGHNKMELIALAIADTAIAEAIVLQHFLCPVLNM